MKQKIRAIERLKDLERIQKFNEEKLKTELEKIDKQKNNYKLNSIFNTVPVKRMTEDMKKKKKLEDYSKKIKMYEHSMFQN